MSRSWLRSCSAAVPALIAGNCLFPSAHAATFSPCKDNLGVCTTVTVPLDYSGVVPGSIVLNVEVVKAAAPSGRALFVAAGGPGAANAIDAVPFSKILLGPLLPSDVDLVFVDYRGTGGSQVIDCEPLQTLITPHTDSDVAACGQKLGTTRGFYTTRDNVADFESVRQALGYGRIRLYGYSYGTQVAGSYLLEFPDNVELAALDGVQYPTGRDPLLRPTAQNAQRVLDAVCSAGRCAGVTADLGADLAQYVRQTVAGETAAAIFDANGRAKFAPFSEFDLVNFLGVASDDGNQRYALVPSYLHAAANGDPAPLARILDLTNAPFTLPVSLESYGYLFANVCEEVAFPWSRTAPTTIKLVQAAAGAFAASGQYGPFDAYLPLEDNTILQPCAYWPTTADAPTIPVDQPTQAPVLVTVGDLDLITPETIARTVAAEFPNATLVIAPALGHVTLQSQLYGAPCATSLYRAFFSGNAVTNTCANNTFTTPIEPAIPHLLSDLTPAPGSTGAAGETVTATAQTIHDALRIGGFYEAPGASFSAGGLRGGDFTLAPTALTLASDAFLPGLAVSGQLAVANATATGTVTLSGIAFGTLTFAADGSVSGVVDNQKVSAKLPHAPSTAP